MSTNFVILTYNQQQPIIVKEEELSTSGQQQPTIVKDKDLSAPNDELDLRVESVVLDGEDLNVFVCLVDCLKHDSATTTSVANGATGCATDDILVCKDFK